MRNSKLGLRALGLAVLGALSMMAVFATGAQAQGSAGKFLISGAGFAAGLNAPFTASNHLLWFQKLIAGRGINIKCKTITVQFGRITSETHGEATITLGGCLVFTHPGDVQLLACTVHSAGAANGIIVHSVLLLPRLHPAGGNPYILFEPLNLGLNFGVDEILGEACAAEGVYPLKGSFVAQVLDNNTVLPLLDFSQAIQLLVGDKLSFGAFPAYLNGEILLHLAGTHAGKTLGVH